MKRAIRKFIPNSLVNLGKHLPVAVLANLIYNFPSKKLKVIGVTGTDGKTTTSNMIYQILKTAGKKVSLVSSINAVIGEKLYDTGFHVTSPDSLMIQRLIKEALIGKSEYIVLEVTSHALNQHRFWGIEFDVGVITNITHEHLDYHKSFENYLMAKGRLLKHSKVGVLNADEKHFNKLMKMARGKVVSFGLRDTADFNPKSVSLSLKLEGDYNLLNALAASAVAFSLRIDKSVIKKALESFENLEGRMEKVKNDLDLRIFVDFAHTPNALENALKSLRKSSKGRLISVFGAASERDESKRPIMGKISAKYADVTVLTEEDARYESPEKIMNEIAKGATEAGAKKGENLFFEENREKAIKLAISLAKRKDTIGIFGKGHEKSINRKGVEYPWSDKDMIEEILDGRKN